MAVWLPRWATDRIRRLERRLRDRDGVPDRPLLLVTQERQRQVITACCQQAAQAGVRADMPLAQARALFATPSVRIETHDPSADAAALYRLAVWAQRFSPVVAADGTDGLLLDVTGCARVWGGEERLLRAVVDAMQRLGFAARVMIAPTLGCAWAVSRFGSKRACLVSPDSVREALAPLPTAALRVDGAVATQLGEVGIERVGDLLELPRSTLPARFGSELLLRLDQALGQAIETIEPVRPVPPAAVERMFDGPTDRVEAIELTVRELLDEVTGELERRSCGARRVDVELLRSDLGPERLTITLGRPSQNAKHLWQLLRPKLERAHLGFGVEAVRVCACVAAKIRHEQAECDGVAGDASAAEIERSCGELLDTLRNRLGEGRVLRASLRESRLPERAFEMRDASDTGSVTAGVLMSDRPSVLFDRPSPSEVIALTPDGPVHRLTWRGEEHGATACVGPERIGGEWWRAHPTQPDRTRDYFAVRDERGRWLWLGRGVESGRWFVHGVWA
ncbi:MAG: DNA polymerase Y family protein [Planctomycetota bacterium]